MINAATGDYKKLANTSKQKKTKDDNEKQNKRRKEQRVMEANTDHLARFTITTQTRHIVNKFALFSIEHILYKKDL
jgi:hypothetical protein